MSSRKFQTISKIAVTIAFFVFYGFSCGDDFPRSEYDFTTTLKVLNEGKTYKIGDTLHLELKINSSDFFDNNTKSNVELENYKITEFLYFGVRSENFNLRQDPDLFDIKVQGLETYDIETNGQWSKFNFSLGCPDIDRTKWDIKLSVILKSKGIFMINPSRFSTITFGDSKTCTNSRFAKLKFIFDNQDTNPELLKDVPLPTNTSISGDDIPERTNSKEIFWINVKS